MLRDTVTRQLLNQSTFNLKNYMQRNMELFVTNARYVTSDKNTFIK